MKRLQAAVEDTFDPAAAEEVNALVSYTRYAPKRTVYDPQYKHPASSSAVSIRTATGAGLEVPATETTVPTSTFEPSSLQWAAGTAATLPTAEYACSAGVPADATLASNTGDVHLTSSITFNSDRIAIKFRIQLPSKPMRKSIDPEAGFTIFRLGALNSPGTIEIKYKPVVGDTQYPHFLVATVGGDAGLTLTAHPHHSDIMIPVYFEFDGHEAVFFVDRSSDHIFSDVKYALPSGTTNVLFGANYHVLKEYWTGSEQPDKNQVFYFDNLEIYDTTIVTTVDLGDEQFPYFHWDNDNCGVIAVVNTDTLPSGYDWYSFVDKGYSAGDVPAVFGFASSAVSNATLYINEQPITIASTATTTAEMLTWLSSYGTMSFVQDGASFDLTFTVVGNQLSVRDPDGKYSYAIRFTGGTGADWDVTKPVIGRIPQAYQHPRTGEVNEGVSILGTTARVDTPRAVQLQYRDTNVATQGAVIGSLANRPATNPAIVRLEPKNFFGSDKAPFPARTLVFGDPNKLSTSRDDASAFRYGVVWERYVQNSFSGYTGRAMIRYPSERGRLGDVVAAWSMDIPIGLTLRGLAINWVSMLPGYEGNSGGAGRWEWESGLRSFPFMLTGSSDYNVIFYLQVATDDYATKWRNIPSLGAYGVKVTGANVWSEIPFRRIDLDTLNDTAGRPLLRGERRTHFRIILGAEPSACTFQGMSYSNDPQSKK